MSTEIPATVSAHDVTSWSDDVDVVVIGFGIAGGCAAVSAAADGARVLVLERAAAAGGTTSLAGGHFYLGGGTAVQQATGHDDSAEEMYKYLVAVSREPELDKIRAYCEGSVEHFNWLEDLGFQFERSYYPGKVVVPPGTEGLSYTGNEKVWPFCEQAKPAPRGHSVPVPGELGGAAMVIDLLVKRAEALGVQIRYETGATNLIVDDDGAVVGVAWKHFTETGAVKADAVILAAGGFAMNPQMVAEPTPALGQPRRTKHQGLVAPYMLGNPNDTGLDIRLGVSAGGATTHSDAQFIKSAAYQPDVLRSGIHVTKRGPHLVAD
ncbi:FAD-binding protein, partial [Mycobacterium avium]|uniref:FAD-binding protein n=1 Tax=Mycobacterium avium TaxID=1764 RepID=UPI00115A4182